MHAQGVWGFRTPPPPKPEKNVQGGWRKVREKKEGKFRQKLEKRGCDAITSRNQCSFDFLSFPSTIIASVARMIWSHIRNGSQQVSFVQLEPLKAATLQKCLCAIRCLAMGMPQWRSCRRIPRRCHSRWRCVRAWWCSHCGQHDAFHPALQVCIHVVARNRCTRIATTQPSCMCHTRWSLPPLYWYSLLVHFIGTD